MHHFKEAKGILSAHNNMNIYRGCTHGCIYCDSRSKCYQMGHDFEDIEVKINAARLLEATLRRRKNKAIISTGAMTDPYIHLEAELGHTRKCLEIIEKYGFGVKPLTKSALILRDLELIQSINKKFRAVVQMTLTTYDEELCKILEPNVSTTKERVAALKAFRDAGVPTVVWFDPLLPFINDTEENLRGILNYCIEAGVGGIVFFGVAMTLREGSRDYFYQKLDESFPGLSKKYHQKYGHKHIIKSDNNAALSQIFRDVCDKHGIFYGRSVSRFIYTLENEPKQMSLDDFL